MLHKVALVVLLALSSSLALGQTPCPTVIGNSAIEINGYVEQFQISMAVTTPGNNPYSINAISFYTDTGGLSCVAGLYTDNGGTPGSLIISSGYQSQVSGWNTLHIAPTTVSGPFWISFRPNGIGNEFAGSGFISGYANMTLGDPLPGTISGFTSWGNLAWSAYASGCAVPVNTPTPTSTPTVTATPTNTFTVTPTPTGCLNFTGWATPETDGSVPGGLTMGIPITFLGTECADYILAYAQVPDAGSSIVVGIYGDGVSGPTTLIAQATAQVAVTGWNVLPLETKVTLAPGVYWLCEYRQDEFYSYVYNGGTGRLFESPNGGWSPQMINDYRRGCPTPYVYSGYQLSIQLNYCNGDCPAVQTGTNMMMTGISSFTSGGSRQPGTYDCDRRYDAFGDSITAGTSGVGCVYQAFAYLWADYVNRWWPETTMYNHGVYGTTSYGLVTQVANAIASIIDGMIDFCTVYIGINDLVTPYGTIDVSTVGGATYSQAAPKIAAFQTRLETQIIDVIKPKMRPGAKIVLMNIYETNSYNAVHYPGWTDYPTILAAYNAAISQVAADTGCILVDNYSLFHNNQDTFIASGDVHPDVSGASYMYEAIKTVFKDRAPVAPTCTPTVTPTPGVYQVMGAFDSLTSIIPEVWIYTIRQYLTQSFGNGGPGLQELDSLNAVDDGAIVQWGLADRELQTYAYNEAPRMYSINGAGVEWDNGIGDIYTYAYWDPQEDYQTATLLYLIQPGGGSFVAGLSSLPTFNYSPNIHPVTVTTAGVSYRGGAVTITRDPGDDTALYVQKITGHVILIACNFLNSTGGTIGMAAHGGGSAKEFDYYWTNPTWVDWMHFVNPTWYGILSASNDAGYGATEAQMQGFFTDAVTACASDGKTQTFFIPPPDNNTFNSWYNTANVPAMKAVATVTGATLTNTYQYLGDWKNQLANDWTIDGLHLNQAGSSVLAAGLACQMGWGQPTCPPTFFGTSTDTPTPTYTLTGTPTCDISATPECYNQSTPTFTNTPTATPTVCGYPGNTCTPTFTPSSKSPDQISGLTLWLDPGTLPQVDGSSISSITDKVQSEVFTNGSYTAPTLKTNILNGYPVMRFNGTTDGLYDGTFNCPNFMGTTTSDWSIITIYRSATDGLQFWFNIAPLAMQHYFHGGNATIGSNYNGGYSGSTGTDFLNQWHTFMWVYSQAANLKELDYDWTPIYTSTAADYGISSPFALTLFTLDGTNFPCQGDDAMLLIYDKNLDASDRNGLHNWMISTFGIP